MQIFWVEGAFITAKGLKKTRKSGKQSPSDVELFAHAIWADNPEQAIRQATEELHGGQWVEKPKVSKKTEADRMREMGMPQFPGFDAPPPRKKK